VVDVGRRAVALRLIADRRRLGVTATGAVAVVDPSTSRSGLFRLVRDRRCAPFPEARVNAIGSPFRGTNGNGDVVGFADMHLHITANERAGGAVIYGEPFDRYGIAEALGHDADVHGADGSLDVTGNLLRTGLPFGTHDTHGWPTFAGWPMHDTVTHQQTYYVWLKRDWLAGERLVVAQTVEDQPICEIEPVKAHGCNETKSVRLQVQTLRGLQRYVDLQAGGRGRGWFRLVYNPRQARRAIERGKLAAKIELLKAYRNKRRYFGVGLGTDTGGFSSLPGPRPDADRLPLTYPFRCYDGKVRFDREQTGGRGFDLNTDGIAHYGLLADLVADMQQHGGGQALRSLFRSAEAYLRLWQRAYRR